MVVITCDGEVFYASRTVEQYLGFHQVSEWSSPLLDEWTLPYMYITLTRFKIPLKLATMSTFGGKRPLENLIAVTIWEENECCAKSKHGSFSLCWFCFGYYDTKYWFILQINIKIVELFVYTRIWEYMIYMVIYIIHNCITLLYGDRHVDARTYGYSSFIRGA